MATKASHKGFQRERVRAKPHASGVPRINSSTVLLAANVAVKRMAAQSSALITADYS
jgi:hypothetical protein